MKQDYFTHPSSECPIHSITEVAEDLQANVQRISRLLKLLKIPVHVKGRMVFLDNRSKQRLREAIETCEVKRGRKSNG